MNCVGANIARLRQAKGLTQHELGEAAGTTAIAMIECGLRKSPRLGTLQKIAGALGVPVAELFEEGLSPEAPQ